MSRACALTDAVVAHFLDGETDPLDVEVGGRVETFDAAALARHRGGCDECTLQLAAARRLDALLARSADVELGDDEITRVLDRVEERLAPPVAASRPARGASFLWIAAGAFVCGLIGFGIAHAFDVGRAPSAAEDVASQRAAVPEEEVAASARSELVITGPRRAIRRGDAAAGDVAIEERLWFGAWMRAGALGWPVDRGMLHDAALAAGAVERLERFRQLVASGSADPRDVADAVLAADDRLAADSLVVLRSAPDMTRRLCSAMRRGVDAAFRVVVRVGGPVADRRIEDHVAADLAACDRVAAELAGVDSRPGRAGLLVRLWSRQRAKARVPDDFALAMRWFVPQPPECDRQIAAVLRRSRDAEERQLCLLALAARADSTIAPAMIAIAEGPRQDEAELAAFALGRMAVGADDLAARGLRRGYLRVAALACRRDPIAEPHLRRMRLSDEERMFLEAGRFDDRQFEVAVALCRDRQVEPVFSDD